MTNSFDIIREKEAGLGVKLNIRKTHIFWSSCDGSKLIQGLFPSNIGMSVLGMKFLGEDVNRDEGFIEG